MFERHKCLQLRPKNFIILRSVFSFINIFIIVGKFYNFTCTKGMHQDGVFSAFTPWFFIRECKKWNNRQNLIFLSERSISLASDLTFTPEISKWFTFFDTFILTMNFVIGHNFSVLWNCATAKLKYCSHITDRSMLWISSLYHPDHLVDWIYPSKLKHLNFLLQIITLASLKDKIPWTIICPRNKFLF